MTQRFGNPITTVAQAQVGATLVEAHNGVRYRIAAINGVQRIDGIDHYGFATMDIVPIDNPLPAPRGNAPGRQPMTVAWRHPGWNCLADEWLANLPTDRYAHEIGADQIPGIEWHPYEAAA